MSETNFFSLSPTDQQKAVSRWEEAHPRLTYEDYTEFIKHRAERAILGLVFAVNNSTVPAVAISQTAPVDSVPSTEGVKPVQAGPGNIATQVPTANHPPIPTQLLQTIPELT